jgi:hypothetical protein
MNRRSFGVFLLIVLLTVAVNEASAFRCGARLVAIGDSKYEVLKKCGEPASVESWLEKRVEPYSVEPFSDGQRFYVQNPTFATVVYIAVEQWLYDFGRNRFLITLLFENNRLTRIENGSYGY